MFLGRTTGNLVTSCLTGATGSVIASSIMSTIVMAVMPMAIIPTVGMILVNASGLAGVFVGFFAGDKLYEHIESGKGFPKMSSFAKEPKNYAERFLNKNAPGLNLKIKNIYNNLVKKTPNNDNTPAPKQMNNEQKPVKKNNKNVF